MFWLSWTRFIRLKLLLLMMIKFIYLLHDNWCWWISCWITDALSKDRPKISTLFLTQGKRHKTGSKWLQACTMHVNQPILEQRKSVFNTISCEYIISLPSPSANQKMALSYHVVSSACMVYLRLWVQPNGRRWFIFKVILCIAFKIMIIFHKLGQ